MKETLHDARGLDETRVKRAFGWIVTFRDFPAGSWQTVDGDSMMRDAVTYFTKGRAEFYLDGVRRKDRVPGTLSTEHEIVGEGGTFELRYVEPTTRVCMPLKIQPAKNKGRQPTVKQHRLEPGEHELRAGKYLVCLGKLTIGDKTIEEETPFIIPDLLVRKATTTELTLLLQFFD